MDKVKRKVLEAILGEDVGRHSVYVHNSDLHYGWFAPAQESRTINIHEFAQKCKQWSASKGFTIVSYTLDEHNQRALIYRTDKLFENEYKYMVEPSKYDTEAEAIIRATEIIFQDLSEL